MRIVTSDGVCEELAPLRFDRTPPQVPTFWATSAEEVIRRAFDRFLAACGKLSAKRRYCTPVVFGWGDYGGISVYKPVGEIRCETGKEATWTLSLYDYSFYGPRKCVDVLQIVVPLNDTKRAADIAVTMLT